MTTQSLEEQTLQSLAESRDLAFANHQFECRTIFDKSYKHAFKDGHASRDAEVAELKRRLETVALEKNIQINTLTSLLTAALEAMKAKDKAAHSLAAKLCRVDSIMATACRDLIDRNSAMELVAAWRREWDVICKTHQDAIKEAGK